MRLQREVNLDPRLERLLEEAASESAAFKSRVDYRRKYAAHFIDMFKLVWVKVADSGNPDGWVSVTAAEMKQLCGGNWRDIKKILNDLYNDDFIYYPVSSRGNLSKGFDSLLGKPSACGRFWLSRPVRECASSGEWPSVWKKREIRVRKLKKIGEDPAEVLWKLLRSEFFQEHHDEILERYEADDSSTSLLSLVSSFNQFNISKKYRIDREAVIVDKLSLEEKLKDKEEKRRALQLVSAARAVVEDCDEVEVSQNAAYLKLSWPDGRPFLSSLPHTGKWRDGRIYSKFHCLSRETRAQLLLDGERIEELWDISHSFPTMLGEIAHGRVPDGACRKYRKYIMENDIYSDVLKWSGLPLSMRDELKPHFNKWIVASPKDFKRCSSSKWKNSPELFKAVAEFMSSHFPEISEMVCNWPLEERKTVCKKNFCTRTKKVKTIVHELQKTEKKIMDNACGKIDSIYVTLHDAVYVKQSDLEHLAGIDFDLLMWQTLGWIDVSLEQIEDVNGRMHDQFIVKMPDGTTVTTWDKDFFKKLNMRAHGIRGDTS